LPVELLVLAPMVFGGLVEEADAAEGMILRPAQIAIEIEAEGGEGFESVGHEAFAAGLVDGRAHGVNDFDVEAFACRGDSGSEAGGACANDEDIRLCYGGAKWHGKAASSLDTTSQE
jgi:hypothetical protein